MQEIWVPALCQEDPLEEEMATHSSILAWRIPGSEDGAQSMGLQRVGHDRATEHTHFWSSTCQTEEVVIREREQLCQRP